MPPDFAERKEWTITSRREFLLNLTGSATAAILPACAPVARPAPIGVPPETLGLSLSEAEIVRGIAFLRRYPSVDVHCHPGRFFLRDVPDPTPSMIAFGAPFEERAAEDLRAGGVSAALFSGVADVRLLEVSRTGVRSTREFAPGEAWADYQRQVRALRSLVARGTLVPGDDPADIGRAHRSGQTGAFSRLRAATSSKTGSSGSSRLIATASAQSRSSTTTSIRSATSRPSRRATTG